MEAIAHHADFVGDFDDFVQTVRHVDHADLFRAQLVEHFKEVVNVVGGQRGCRFVQHQHLGLDGDGAGNRQQRLFGA